MSNYLIDHMSIRDRKRFETAKIAEERRERHCKSRMYGKGIGGRVDIPIYTKTEIVNTSSDIKE